MKKKFIVLLLTLSFIFTFVFKPLAFARAEEIETEPITEEVVEEKKGTIVNEWLKENLGWVVGLPTGVVIQIFLEAILLYKKNKQKFEELEDTKDVKKFAKDVVEDTKKLAKDVKGAVECVKENTEKTLKRFDETDRLLKQTLEEFSAVKKENENIKEVLKIMAYHSKEYVTNGSAEEIYKLLGGVNEKEEI